MVFLTFILVMFTFFARKTNTHKKNLITLFLILSLLSSGLYLGSSPLYLLFLGLLSFILIFFADENIFDSVYFKIKKSINTLKVGDKIENSIKLNSKTLIDKYSCRSGLSKENISLIKEKLSSNSSFKIMKILPFSTLISINFMAYVFKIVSIDNTNLQLLSFLFKFLFFSFIAGGILAIVMIGYFFIKSYKKIKLNLSQLTKALLLFSFIISLALSILISSSFYYLIVLIGLFLFIKTAKQVEKLMFVKKKNIGDIVPGDWVVCDVKLPNGKKIFDAQDFKLGIDEVQIEKIKSLAKKHKDFTSLLVKDGIAFLPPMFVAFIYMLI